MCLYVPLELAVGRASTMIAGGTDTQAQQGSLARAGPILPGQTEVRYQLARCRAIPCSLPPLALWRGYRQVWRRGCGKVHRAGRCSSALPGSRDQPVDLLIPSDDEAFHYCAPAWTTPGGRACPRLPMTLHHRGVRSPSLSAVCFFSDELPEGCPGRALAGQTQALSMARMFSTPGGSRRLYLWPLAEGQRSHRSPGVPPVLLRGTDVAPAAPADR